jgi:ketosteroid isomerase-like protein
MPVNRRCGALIAAVAIVGFAGLPVRAQSQTDISAVTAVNDAYYAAISALDMAAVEKLWSHESYITWIGPHATAPVAGWPAVQSSLKGLIERYAQVSQKPSDTHVYAIGTMAWVVGRETTDTRLKDGSTGTGSTLVTNIFENKDGHWRMVSHHANLVPKQ